MDIGEMEEMRMNHRRSRIQQSGVVIIVGLFVLSLITACVSDQPKPSPQLTPDQVRGHADRSFEKLKQEEQERNAQPPVPR